MTEPVGPLADVDPDSLTAVFAADPLTLTDAQLEVLVIELRRRRNAWLAKEAAKFAEGHKGRQAKVAAKQAEEAAELDVPPEEFKLKL